MPNLNQVNLIGHVTRAVELRYTPNKKAVASIGLALNRTWTTDDNKEQSEVCFVDITAWGRLAEVCAEFLQKGHPVFFTGRLKQESWVDAEQQKRTKLVVVAESMQLLTRKPGTATSEAPSTAGEKLDPKRVFPNSRPVPAGIQSADDEIPF